MEGDVRRWVGGRVRGVLGARAAGGRARLSAGRLAELGEAGDKPWGRVRTVWAGSPAGVAWWDAMWDGSGMWAGGLGAGWSVERPGGRGSPRGRV